MRPAQILQKELGGARHASSYNLHQTFVSFSHLTLTHLFIMSIRQYSRVLFLVVVLSVLLLPAAYHRELVGHTLSKITTVTYSAARHSGWQPRNDLTRVLAHAPGFTVIENL